MEPNKFDNIFKEKLEQRTIQPTEMAWDRLDAMLSVTEEKTEKPRKKRTWMYVAASFLGFLLMGTIFIKQGNSDNGTDMKSTGVQVAVTPEPEVKQGNVTTENRPSTTNETLQTEEAVVINVIPESKSEGEKNTKGSNDVQKVLKEKTQANTKMPTVVEEAVAQSHKNEDVDKPLTNETETFLAEANTSQAKKPAIKVNASSLLSSVESDLDNSFRSKAMQTLVKNYNSVKTSVANRNHK